MGTSPVHIYLTIAYTVVSWTSSFTTTAPHPVHGAEKEQPTYRGTWCWMWSRIRLTARTSLFDHVQGALCIVSLKP